MTTMFLLLLPIRDIGNLVVTIHGFLTSVWPKASAAAKVRGTPARAYGGTPTPRRRVLSGPSRFRPASVDIEQKEIVTHANTDYRA